MGTTTLLFVVAAAAVVWGIVSGLRIFVCLQRRGERVNFLLISLMVPVYVHRYARITREETGRTGVLFYHYVIAFNLALVSVLIAWILSAV